MFAALMLVASGAQVSSAAPLHFARVVVTDPNIVALRSYFQAQESKARARRTVTSALWVLVRATDTMHKGNVEQLEAFMKRKAAQQQAQPAPLP